MEKRSLQSGNTFFPVIVRRLTGSPAASFIENCVMMRAHGNGYINGVVKMRLNLQDRNEAMDFFKYRAQTFFPYPSIITNIYKDCASPVQ